MASIHSVRRRQGPGSNLQARTCTGQNQRAAIFFFATRYVLTWYLLICYREHRQSSTSLVFLLFLVGRNNTIPSYTMTPNGPSPSTNNYQNKSINQPTSQSTIAYSTNQPTNNQSTDPSMIHHVSSTQINWPISLLCQPINQSTSQINHVNDQSMIIYPAHRPTIQPTNQPTKMIYAFYGRVVSTHCTRDYVRT